MLIDQTGTLAPSAITVKWCLFIEAMLLLSSTSENLRRSVPPYLSTRPADGDGPLSDGQGTFAPLPTVDGVVKLAAG